MCLFFILYLLSLTFIVGVVALAYEKKTNTPITSQVYQKREGSNPSGSFGYKRAGKTNPRTLSKTYKKEVVRGRTRGKTS